MAAGSQADLGDMPDREGSFDSSAMMGPRPASPMPSPKDQSKGIVSQFKGVHTTLSDMAKQFPAGSKEISKAQDALKEAMVKIISEMQKPEQGGAAAAA